MGPSRLQRWQTPFPVPLAPDACSGSSYRIASCEAIRSLYRLCARTSGVSPRDAGAKTNLVYSGCPEAPQFLFTLALLRFLTATGLCRRSRVRCSDLRRNPLPSCSWPLQGLARPQYWCPLPAPSTLVLCLGSCDLSRDFSGLFHCNRVSSSILRPAPTFTLLGVRPSREFPRDTVFRRFRRIPRSV